MTKTPANGLKSRKAEKQAITSLGRQAIFPYIFPQRSSGGRRGLFAAGGAIVWPFFYQSSCASFLELRGANAHSAWFIHADEPKELQFNHMNHSKMRAFRRDRRLMAIPFCFSLQALPYVVLAGRLTGRGGTAIEAGGA